MDTTQEKTTHTPGPWTAEFNTDGTILIYGPDGFRIHDAGNSKRAWMPVAEANRRLLAAVPDLLAALVDQIEDARCYCDDTIAMAGRDKCKVCVARAAVAKAEGSVSHD